MPPWIAAGFEEYARRMPREMRVELVAIKPGNEMPAQNRKTEAARLRLVRPAGALLVVLDEQGRALTTPALAKQMAAWRANGGDVMFLIGGADGLEPALKAEADLMLALSTLTLPHALVRVLLAEQLYRAWTILQGHPYHRC